MTLVSLVMPVRDGSRYLDEAVAGVLGQTHRDLSSWSSTTGRRTAPRSSWPGGRAATHG